MGLNQRSSENHKYCEVFINIELRADAFDYRYVSSAFAPEEKTDEGGRRGSLDP